MSWNVKTWRKISGALKNCALACHSDIILLQEPRIAVSLPDYTAIHSYETTKLNTAILLKANLNYRELIK